MFEALVETVGSGPLACLGAASLWAVSVSLFRGPVRRFGPTDVNLAKTSIASILLGLTTLLAGQFDELTTAPGRAIGIVALSGFVGMTLGDTALFAAVDRIGVHRTLLLQTFAPVFAACLSYAVYGERLTARQVAGALVVLVGVALVVGDRRGASNAVLGASASGLGPGLATGLLLALAAAAGQGSGVVLAKIGMVEISFLPASFLRLFVACSALILTQIVRRGLGGATRRLRGGVFSGPGLRRILPPSFLGTYVAVLLMMVGISLAPAAVAAVLLATTPVFGLFIDAWVSRRPINASALVGTILAVAGVALLSIS